MSGEFVIPPAKAAQAGLLLVCATAGCLLASSVSAQTMNTSASSYNTGYGASSAGEFNAPVNFNNRDANGNRVIVDGVIQNGSDNSIYNRRSSGGAVDTVSGVGGVGGAVAIGNNLTVITQGNNNTVIVNSTQTNTGAITATTVLNGQVNLNNGG